MRTTAFTIRITSYNVCYTKLLRHELRAGERVERYEVNLRRVPREQGRQLVRMRDRVIDTIEHDVLEGDVPAGSLFA